MAVLRWILCFLTLCAVIFEITSETTPPEGMIFGSGSLNVSKGEDYKCKVFQFIPPFAAGEARVQLRLFSEEYSAAVTWTEEISTSGFKGCVATTSAIPASGRTIMLQWMAYQSVNRDNGYTNRRAIPVYTTGTVCVDQLYEKVYPTPPYVFLTAVHKSLQNKHDAAIVWAEDVTYKGFRACVRELKNFDGVHKKVEVDILVLANKPSGWNVPWRSDILFPNTEIPSAAQGYSYCKTVNFINEFYRPPTMITTAEHHKDNVKANIDADNNAMQEWVRKVTKTHFEVCLKDIQRYDAVHDPITVNYMAVGHYNPCINISCPYYGVCKPISETKYSCICVPCTTEESEPLCDNNDYTHQSICKYKYKVCMDKEEPGIKHYGGCKPFVIQRGRVVLRLDMIDVQCRLVKFKTSFEASRGSVHLQTSINYFNHTGSFVHDAAVTWVESVNLTSFEVCALKAGRAERLTPDGGLTFIDYVAFQEAPVDTVAGQALMSDWWDGTNCKSIKLAKSFDSPPYVLVTAEHSKRSVKHDAATVWVENVLGNIFSVCVRELQNFDGQHKDIKVNWIAFAKLPDNLLSQQHKLAFYNTNPPRLEDHNAYCKILGFNKVYHSAPTIIVSAAHDNSVAFSMRPDYNSIATWAEQITSTNCRVCIKELTNLNGYDPVYVSMLVIGIPSSKCNSASALGVSNQLIIADNQMTASSQMSTSSQASYGRLNGSRGDGWCAKQANSSHDWLQVDLGKTVQLCSVRTQGEVNGTRWVTDFKLRYSTDGTTWTPYMDANGAQVEFHRTGVTTSSTITTQKLPVPVTARYLRFSPTKQHNWNCLRVELFGY